MGPVNSLGMCSTIITGMGIDAGKSGNKRIKASGPPVDTPMRSASN